MSRLDALASRLFQAHPWHGIPPGDPGRVTAFIEIVPEDTVKYELDKGSGQLKIDRVQRYSSLCPTLYGFVPQTWCGPAVAKRWKKRGLKGDGDPLDICVLTETSIPKGSFLVEARPIGGLRILDGREADDKIVAVLETDLLYGDLKDLRQVPKAIVERLEHYFLSYKRPPGKKGRGTVELAGVYGAAEAGAVVAAAIDDYREEYGAPETRFAELSRLLGPGRR